MIGAISHADLGTLFVVLAIVAFGLALYVGYLGNLAACLVLALVGILILLFA